VDGFVAQSKAAAKVATAIMTDVPIAQLLAAPTRYEGLPTLSVCVRNVRDPE